MGLVRKLVKKEDEVEEEEEEEGRGNWKNVV